MIKQKKIVRNIFYFFLPICLGLVALSFVFKQNANLQMQIISLAIILYFIFSLIHHYFDKTLTVEVIIEYVLIAGLTFILVFSSF